MSLNEASPIESEIHPLHKSTICTQGISPLRGAEEFNKSISILCAEEIGPTGPTSDILIDLLNS